MWINQYWFATPGRLHHLFPAPATAGVTSSCTLPLPARVFQTFLPHACDWLCARDRRYVARVSSAPPKLSLLTTVLLRAFVIDHRSNSPRRMRDRRDSENEVCLHRLSPRGRRGNQDRSVSRSCRAFQHSRSIRRHPSAVPRFSIQSQSHRARDTSLPLQQFHTRAEPAVVQSHG